MTFEAKLKFVREKLSLSQEALAREIGVTFATLNRWENGKNEPNFLAKKAFSEFCLKNGITEFMQEGESNDGNK